MHRSCLRRLLGFAFAWSKGKSAGQGLLGLPCFYMFIRRLYVPQGDAKMTWGKNYNPVRSITAAHIMNTVQPKDERRQHKRTQELFSLSLSAQKRRQSITSTKQEAEHVVDATISLFCLFLSLLGFYAKHKKKESCGLILVLPQSHCGRNATQHADTSSHATNQNT